MMKNLFILVLCGFFTELKANESMTLRCDGRITFYDEFTNIQIKLDKLTGMLTERRLYPRTSSNDLFIMTYQCKKITSKPLW